MIFYVSWNHALSYYEYIDQIMNCPKCQSEQTMQIRVYLDKTKLYGLATVANKYSARAVCRRCLTEFGVNKAFEKELLIRFKADLEVAKVQEEEVAKLKEKEGKQQPR